MEHTDTRLPEFVFIPLLKSFLSSLSFRLNEIEHSLQTQDVSEIHRLAHQLNGSASSYGFPKIAQLAYNIEKNTDGIHLNIPLVSSLFLNLKSECKSAILSFAKSK